MAEISEVVCISCKGKGHKRNTNKLCPNSRWGKIRAMEKIEHTDRLKKALSKFEEFILAKKITVDQLPPAYCSNWMEIERCRGLDRSKWKLEFDLRRKLFDLHYGIASLVYGHDFDKTEIVDYVSTTTKKIYGMVGSNAGEWWYGTAYGKAHYGTIILLKLWNITIESENVIL